MTDRIEQRGGSPDVGLTGVFILAELGLNAAKKAYAQGDLQPIPIDPPRLEENDKDVRSLPSTGTEIFHPESLAQQRQTVPPLKSQVEEGRQRDVAESEKLTDQIAEELAPYLRGEVGQPRLNLPRTISKSDKKLAINKRAIISVAAATATVLAVGIGANWLKGKDTDTPSPVPVATSSSAPSVSPEAAATKPLEKTNLELVLTAANIVGTESIATTGFNASGSLKVAYKGKDGKNHELKEFNGQKLSWALTQGIEYYVIPKKADIKPFTVKRENGKTIVNINLNDYRLKFDPTINTGQLNNDGTIDQFAVDLFANTKPPLTANDLEQSKANSINTLITDPKTTLNKDTYSTPQQWNKLSEADRLATAAVVTNFLVVQLGAIEKIEAKESICGADIQTTFTTSAAAHMEANIRKVLTSLGVETEGLIVKVDGSLENNALEAWIKTSPYQKMYTTAQKVKAQLLIPNIVSMACTVTPEKTEVQQEKE